MTTHAPNVTSYLAAALDQLLAARAAANRDTHGLGAADIEKALALVRSIMGTAAIAELASRKVVR